MKKTLFARTAAMLLASSFVLGLASCGDSGSDSSNKTENGSSAYASGASKKDDGSFSVKSTNNIEEGIPAVPGTTVTCGRFTFLAPTGWTYELGRDSLVGAEVAGELYVRNGGSGLLKFNIGDADGRYKTALSTYTDNQKVLTPTTYGEFEWTVFQYGTGENRGFAAKAGRTDMDVFVLASGGFDFDTPEVKALLWSMKIPEMKFID